MIFLLVHGAWHGGWCWRRVLPFLRDAGHEVFTPTLTGVGERAHLLRPDIDLDTHIEDVVKVLEMEDLNGVVLVGHSYGGMVITGVADRVPDRLRRLVYLDAFIPQNGRAVVDYIGAERAAHQRAEGEKDGTLAPLPLKALGISRAEDAAWVSAKLTRHPYRTMVQPLRLVNQAAPRSIPRSFVNCRSATGTFDQFVEQVQADAAWTCHELPAGHDAMITDPAGVARVLLSDP